MCRLFGMTTGGPRVQASHWLIDAPRSLRAQSHRMPHGAGLGWFSLGHEPVRDRAPLAAFESPDFALHARNVVSHTFVAHVRDASVGGLTVHNCHPFVMNDRLFAHNGVVKGRRELLSWLTEVECAHVAGETDSELVFAYLTAEIRRRGDTTEGIVEAVRRIGAELPVFSLNMLLAESGRLWALRYPASNELWVRSPASGGVSGPAGPMDVVGHADPAASPGAHVAHGRAMTRVQAAGDAVPADATHHGQGAHPSHVAHAVHGPHLDGTREGTGTGGGTGVPAVVVASEPMDDHSGWRLLEPGELLIVDGLAETSIFPFGPLRHPLSRADLSLREAASQGIAPTPHKVIPVSQRPPIAPVPLPDGKVTVGSGAVEIPDDRSMVTDS